METRASPSFRVVLRAVLLVGAAISGCTLVGPDYRQPDVAPPDQFRSHVGANEASSLADLPWWQVFNDKALQALIKQALNENYDLQVATARIEQARAQVGVARADLYPQVGYEAIGSRQKAFQPLDPSGNITFNTFGVDVNSVWEIDLWGRVRRSTEAARAALFAQQDVRRAVMLSLVSDVAAGYFTLIELDRQMAIAQESAATYSQMLNLFTLRFEAGRDSRLAVVRAQAALDASNATIASLNRVITQQENALSVLLGAYPRDIGRGARLIEQVMPTTPTGLTTAVLQRRPDILQAEQVMIGANAEIGVAVANFFPVVGLSALFGGQGPNVEDIFDDNFSIWHIGAGLTGSIFEGGRLRANYQARKAFWDQTVAQYRRTVVSAFREASDALAAQQTLAIQRAALEGQVRSLRAAVDLALTRYDAGRASYFEVLEAQQLLFPAEDALAQTQRDQLIAVVNLYKALGGGWSLPDADWTKVP